MTAHLLALTIGPVQEFIAAARRTRDLWFGSYLLSEISKAAAKAVRDSGGMLIFPAPRDDAELEAGSLLNVANIVLAELPEADPSAVAQAAKQAAKNRWRNFADEVFSEHQTDIHAEIWNEQVDDVIEFCAAWTSLGDNYAAARSDVMRLLRARKLCRDFAPAEGRPGVPKSSLDGLRESALKDRRGKPENAHDRRRIRLRPGEQLDVVGLVKRTAGGTRRYPSVSRIAADPWIRGLPPESLGTIIKECKNLGSDLIHQLDTSSAEGHAHYAAFPYEGTAVYASRHREALDDVELNDDDIRPLIDALRKLTRKYGEPEPYLAMLVADGDRVGQALSQRSSGADHRSFSQTLARFAEEARRVVHEHSGVLVYAGGDDVLAFVPVDRCLACARALHEKFGGLLTDWSPNPGEKLSLSVGVAIAHFMEPLEDLREYGQIAEQHAKNPRDTDGQSQQPRNGLAVHLLKRGGGPVAVRANWNDSLDGWLACLANLLNDRAIPSRIAADLHQVARVYEKWPGGTVKDAIQRDTLRVISAKQPRGENALHQIRELVNDRVCDASSLRRLADELLVARQLASALRQAQPNIATEEPTA